MRVCLGPEDVGENDRIAGVRFGTAGPMPTPITGNAYGLMADTVRPEASNAATTSSAVPTPTARVHACASSPR